MSVASSDQRSLQTALERLGLDLLEGEPEVLKASSKATVYHLPAAGPGGTALIAKHGEPGSLRLEELIYQQVLPRLGSPSLRCLGSLHDGGPRSWLVIEKAVGVPYDPTLPSHRVRAARWLAQLHGAVPDPDVTKELPDRGERHYLARLHTAREALGAGFENPLMPADGRPILRDVLLQLDRLEETWHRVVARAELLPACLVHGDFVAKNVRLRHGREAVGVQVFDWEVAGWGSPGVDLARFVVEGATDAINHYCELAGRSFRDVWRSAQVGIVFRLLAAIDWIAVELCLPEAGTSEAYPDWLRRAPLGDLGLYRGWMQDALRDLAL